MRSAIAPNGSFFNTQEYRNTCNAYAAVMVEIMSV
jgi:hypothetical protein